MEQVRDKRAITGEKSLVHYPPKLLKLDRLMGYPGAGLKYIVAEIQGGQSSYKLSDRLLLQYKFLISPMQIREYYHRRDKIRELHLKRIEKDIESWL